MNEIKLLNENLINQIAAGEVVERPASAVKELIENSLDAKADSIIIMIKNSGFDLISVTDNGTGMSKEDAILCLERHATSKIETLDDLNAVKTLGFRGEALASIASVSRLSILTRRVGNDFATEIYIEAGEIKKMKVTGSPVGTTIEVKDLFFNTPARKKFSKSNLTEYQNILDIVINCAISNPHVAITFIKDEKIILKLPKVSDHSIRIRGIFGKSVSDEMVEVFYHAVNLKINGWIGKPQIARSTRNTQYFFVNGRPIKTAVLSYAVKQAYGTLLIKEKNPVFFLFINIAPNMVDVNVHPRKNEVRFSDEREIYRAVSASVNASLNKNIMAPSLSDNQPINFYRDKSPQGLKTDYSNGNSSFSEDQNMSFDFVQKNDENKQNTQKSIFENLQIIGQHDNAYIICRSNNDLIIIDQHAAHERVRFENLLKEHAKKDHKKQALLTPISFELNPMEQSVLNENKKYFEDLGVEIEHFGGNTFSVSAIPSFLMKCDLEKVIISVLEDLKNHQKSENFEEKSQRIFESLACKSAVKFGDSLEIEEQIALVEALKNTQNKYTCPHGRPTMIFMKEKELLARFGRDYIKIKNDSDS